MASVKLKDEIQKYQKEFKLENITQTIQQMEKESTQADKSIIKEDADLSKTNKLKI